jgi:hypothetical protein
MLKSLQSTNPTLFMQEALMRVVAAFASVLALLITPALAEDAAVVILDVQGETTPAIELFDELPSGVTLDLGADSTVQLGHYATCSEVTVVGGTIAIEPERVMFDKNQSVTKDGETCVSNVTIAAADVVSASIVTRSVGRGGPLIAPRPMVAENTTVPPNSSKCRAKESVISWVNASPSLMVAAVTMFNSL